MAPCCDGCGDAAGTPLDLGLLEHGDLAGGREQPGRIGHPGGLDSVRVRVDEQDLVAVVQQLPGDRAPDAAGSGDATE